MSFFAHMAKTVMDNNGDRVEIEVDGVTVVGSIEHRSVSDFTIRITEPFANLCTGSHIPWYARGKFSFEGEYGDKRIRENLKYLFELGKYLEENLEVLKERYKSFEAKINNLSSGKMNRERFNERRRELRRRLRAGEIDNKEYQRLLTPLRKERERLEMLIQNQIDAFFSEYFSMMVPWSTKKQVIDILKGEKDLRPC